MAEVDFRGQAEKYRRLYRELWQRRIHGGVYPNHHFDTELPVLEVAAIINRSKSSEGGRAPQPHLADDLRREGFSASAAVDIMVKGLKDSGSDEVRRAIRERYLPALAEIPDEKIRVLALAALGQNAGLEEVSATAARLAPGPVLRNEVHVFDPQNADIGRVVAGIQKDPVVIIAEDSAHEQLLLGAGFIGEIINLNLYGGDIEKARRDAAASFPGYSPRFYRADQRRNWIGWLAGILERYNVTSLTVQEAAEIVDTFSVLRAA